MYTLNLFTFYINKQWPNCRTPPACTSLFENFLLKNRTSWTNGRAGLHKATHWEGNQAFLRNICVNKL